MGGGVKKERRSRWGDEEKGKGARGGGEGGGRT